MIKACRRSWEQKLGHVFVGVTADETDVCIQEKKDWMAAIIQPNLPENDGFIG